ncbi:MAG: hypothetical protein ABIQ05_09805 [Candidatus Limnocylindria bacterium]
MEEDAAADVVRRLEALGVDYCITGSETLPRYGEPRQTAGIDIVLAMPVREFGRIRDAFEADYVVNEPIVARGRAMASVVAQSGLARPT